MLQKWALTFVIEAYAPGQISFMNVATDSCEVMILSTVNKRGD